MSKKGISPLIGTVLLVTITIAMVLMIMPWITKIIEEHQSEVKMADDFFVFTICEDKVVCYTNYPDEYSGCIKDEELYQKYCNNLISCEEVGCAEGYKCKDNWCIME